jgi:hypothetical protein
MSKLSKVHDPATTSTTATAKLAQITATQQHQGAKVDSNEPAVNDFSGAG